MQSGSAGVTLNGQILSIPRLFDGKNWNGWKTAIDFLLNSQM